MENFFAFCLNSCVLLCNWKYILSEENSWHQSEPEKLQAETYTADNCSFSVISSFWRYLGEGGKGKTELTEDKNILD